LTNKNLRPKFSLHFQPNVCLAKERPNYTQEKNMSARRKNCHFIPGSDSIAVAGTGSPTIIHFLAARTRSLSTLLLFLVLLYVPQTTLAGPAGPPPSVVVEAVTEADIVPATEYVGHVEAIQAVDLLARVEGFLEKVRFKEGDFVHAGDVLFQIEQEAYKARTAADQGRVEQAKTDLDHGESYLKRLRGARAENFPATDIDNAVADVLMNKAKLAEME
jgi:multidrug efflux pump subunit AcrA (membrane-fusion protein)